MDSENTDGLGEAGQASTAGSRLRKAREAAGLSRADIASQTKIAERHLIAIEEDRFGDLAARTYAVGFTRAYARALGLDETEIADDVRKHLDAEEAYHTQPETHFEPGDPARVPPVRLAWIAAGAAVVVIGALLLFWSNFLSPEGKLPDLIAEQTAAPQAAPMAAPTAQVAAPTGPVVLTSTSDRVWLRVTDADGNRLLEKEMSKDERWTVPDDAKSPELRTGRPDALRVSVGSKDLGALASEPQTVSGISLVAADLLGVETPEATPQPAPATTTTPRREAPSPRTTPSPTPSPTATRPAPVPSSATTRAPTPTPTPNPRPRATAPAPTASPTSRATAQPTPRPTATRSPAPQSTPSPRPTPSPSATAAAPTPSASPAPAPQTSAPAPVSTDSE